MGYQLPYRPRVGDGMEKVLGGKCGKVRDVMMTRIVMVSDCKLGRREDRLRVAVRRSNLNHEFRVIWDSGWDH